MKEDGPKLSIFGPTLIPRFLLKVAEIEKNSISTEKRQPYPNMPKSRLYLFSPFREKYDYFLQYLGYFC